MMACNEERISSVDATNFHVQTKPSVLSHTTLFKYELALPRLVLTENLVRFLKELGDRIRVVSVPIVDIPMGTHPLHLIWISMLGGSCIGKLQHQTGLGRTIHNYSNTATQQQHHAYEHPQSSRRTMSCGYCIGTQ
jgi:hypothetical protein